MTWRCVSPPPATSACDMLCHTASPLSGNTLKPPKPVPAPHAHPNKGTAQDEQGEAAEITRLWSADHTALGSGQRRGGRLGLTGCGGVGEGPPTQLSSQADLPNPRLQASCPH